VSRIVKENKHKTDTVERVGLVSAPNVSSVREVVRHIVKNV